MNAMSDRESDAWIELNVFGIRDDEKITVDCDGATVTTKDNRHFIRHIPRYGIDPAASRELEKVVIERIQDDAHYLVATFKTQNKKEWVIKLIGTEVFEKADTLEKAWALFAYKLFSKND